MEIIRKPSNLVHPDNERRWLRSYERWLSEHGTNPPDKAEMEAAANYADATWENVAGMPTVTGSAVARCADAMGVPTATVPRNLIEWCERFERDVAREASPDEIRKTMQDYGIDPLLARAQRTVPGAGLPAEVPPASLDVDDAAPAKKKRGRPPKAPGAPAGLAGSAPPKPAQKAAGDLEAARERRIKKAADELMIAANEIAAVLGGLEPRFRRDVIELGFSLSKATDDEIALRDRVKQED